MVISMFDQQLFKFTCKCGKVTEEVLSNLDNVTTFACPACGFLADLKVDPWRTHLMDLRHIAAELDKKAIQRGEVIQRIK